MSAVPDSNVDSTDVKLKPRCSGRRLVLTILLKKLLVFIVDLLMYFFTILAGLIIGKAIVFNLDHVFDSFRDEDSLAQIYKEVGIAAIVALVVLRYVIVPHYKIFLNSQLSQTPDSFFDNLSKIFFLQLCYVPLIILFDIRFCKRSFTIEQVVGPIEAIKEMVLEVFFKGESGSYGSLGHLSLETICTIPLILTITIPIYCLLKFYWSIETENDSIVPIVPTIPEKFAYPDPDTSAKFASESWNWNWRAAVCATMLEMSEYFLFNVVILTIVKLSDAASWKLGAVGTLAITPICLTTGFIMIYTENWIPGLAKFIGNCTQLRIFQNFFFLANFVPRIFSLFFGPIPTKFYTKPCSDGKMLMGQDFTISNDFVTFSAISIYAAWKIAMLCFSTSSKENHAWISLRPKNELKLKSAENKNIHDLDLGLGQSDSPLLPV